MAGVDSYTKLMFHCQRPDNTLPKAVTFAGTAALDTAQYKFGSSSLLLDGNSDYLTVADSADWYFASGDFTIDFWVRFNTVQEVLMLEQFDSSSSYWQLYFNTANNRFTVEAAVGGSTTVQWFFNSQTWNTAQWYHIAVVRSGSTIYFFRDGVSQTASTTTIGAFPDCATALGIGARYNGTYGFLDGWLDSLRISKGIARWTADFTPPTEPVLSDAYTNLLLNFDGADGATATYDSAGGDETYTTDHAPTFVNQATYDTTHAVTFAGTAQLDTAQKKFGTSSLLLDGNSDYITIPDSPDWVLSADFTIDFWIRFNNLPAFSNIVTQYTDTSNFFQLYADDSGFLHLKVEGSSGETLVDQSSAGLSTGTWYHVAVVRSGNSWAIYKDGTSVATATSSNGFTDYTGTLRIGQGEYPSYPNYLDGWIDAFRWSKGYARWTTNFTAPTTAPVADTRTQLLLNFDDGVDGAQATNNEIGSLFLDGNADYVTIADSADWDFGTGDFTIDFWYKVLDTSGGLAITFLGRVTSGSSYLYWSFEGAGTRVRDYGGGGSIDFNNTLSVVPGQWFHMALTRKGTNFRTFCNGVQYGSTYSNAAGFVDRSDPLIIGAMTQNSSYVMKGWIREFRVTKGYARWTANFTPPVDLYTFGPDPVGTPSQGSMSTNTGYWGGIL